MQDYDPRSMSGSLDYWRAEFDARPVVFWLIVVHCCAAILIHVSPLLTHLLVVHPLAVFEHAQVWRLITGTFFLDGGLLQLIVTTWGLWVWGGRCERELGDRDLLAFYLSAGMLANLAWGIVSWSGAAAAPAFFGAPGALAACGVYSALNRPAADRALRIDDSLRKFFGLLVFLSVELGVMIPGPAGAIELAAGMAFAILYDLTDRHWRLVRWFAWRRQRQRLALVRSLENELTRSDSGREPLLDDAQQEEESFQQQMDAILAKIGRSGVASLSPAEMEFLRQASERFRRRRT